MISGVVHKFLLFQWISFSLQISCYDELWCTKLNFQRFVFLAPLRTTPCKNVRACQHFNFLKIAMNTPINKPERRLGLSRTTGSIRKSSSFVRNQFIHLSIHELFVLNFRSLRQPARRLLEMYRRLRPADQYPCRVPQHQTCQHSRDLNAHRNEQSSTRKNWNLLPKISSNLQMRKAKITKILILNLSVHWSRINGINWRCWVDIKPRRRKWQISYLGGSKPDWMRSKDCASSSSRPRPTKKSLTASTSRANCSFDVQFYSFLCSYYITKCQ